MSDRSYAEAGADLAAQAKNEKSTFAQSLLQGAAEMGKKLDAQEQSAPVAENTDAQQADVRQQLVNEQSVGGQTSRIQELSDQDQLGETSSHPFWDAFRAGKKKTS